MGSPSLESVALGFVTRGTLADKLAAFDLDALVPATGLELFDVPNAPARVAPLAVIKARDALPKVGQLASPQARAQCLHRFANHELQAVELFAWAALRFADAPWTFRLGLMRILQDEQRHLQLYLDRMAAYGMVLGDLPLNGYFWEQAPRMQTPLQFVCAMGLTLEAANLDFSLRYRDAFAAAGAQPDADAVQAVHDDEVGHVAWGLSWLRRLKDPAQTDLEAYCQHVPFPMGLHRAKGRDMAASARRAAGLDEGFIKAVAQARSPQQDASLRPVVPPGPRHR